MAIVAWLAAAAPAAGEGFADIALGAAFVQNDEFRFSSNVPTAVIPTRRIASFEVSPSVAVRGGYWFEGPARFVGLGLDLSYYRAFEDTHTGRFKFWVAPVTPLLMVRLPLGQRDDKFPGGRLQPYAAAGPAINFSFVKGNIPDVGGFDVEDFYDSHVDLGLDVRGGLAVQLARWVALYTEYRFTYFKGSYRDNNFVGGFFAPDVTLDVNTELATHHATLGISFRF